MPLPQFSPRCLILCRRFVILALCLYVGRIGIGLGLGYLHYQSTPDFDAYLGSHPVSPTDLAPYLPRAGVVQTQTSFHLGEIVPEQISDEDAERLRLTQALQLELAHGEERLLDLQLDFDLAAQKSDLAKLGMVVSTSKTVVDPRMNLQIYVEFVYAEPHASNDGEFPASAYVDTYLVAGPGPTELHFLRGVERRATVLSPTAFLPWWAVIAGIVHNTKALPEEGLIYHFQNRINFDWQKTANGSSGPGKFRPEFHANSEEYSYRWQAKVEDTRALGAGMTMTTEIAHTRRWNEQIW